MIERLERLEQNGGAYALQARSSSSLPVIGAVEGVGQEFRHGFRDVADNLEDLSRIRLELADWRQDWTRREEEGVQTGTAMMSVGMQGQEATIPEPPQEESEPEKERKETEQLSRFGRLLTRAAGGIGRAATGGAVDFAKRVESFDPLAYASGRLQRGVDRVTESRLRVLLRILRVGEFQGWIGRFLEVGSPRKGSLRRSPRVRVRHR